MTSDTDILKMAHLMLHEYGGDAEFAAALYAELMLGCGDRDAVLTWSRVRRSIVMMDRAPAGPMH